MFRHEVFSGLSTALFHIVHGSCIFFHGVQIFVNGLGCRACQPVFREQAVVSPPCVQSSFGTPMFQHEVFSGSLTALFRFAKKDQKMDWSACNGGDLPIAFDYVM